MVWTIGKLAKEAGVNVETVRFYERKGLIKQPQKIGAFRRYNELHLSKIIFIKRAQTLGFSLKEIEEILDMYPYSGSSKKELQVKTMKVIQKVNLKISYLQQMDQALVRFSHTLGEEYPGKFSILEELGWGKKVKVIE